jgi:hypothetical protein
MRIGGAYGATPYTFEDGLQIGRFHAPRPRRLH